MSATGRSFARRPPATGAQPAVLAAGPTQVAVRPRDGYKRAFDMGLLVPAAVAFAPLWVPLAALLALAIRLQDGGPVLYRQWRVGRGGKVFEIVKLRTMAVDAEGATGPVWALPGDDRATPLGRVLRRLRLDELPQALNVLRGEMSLVGPRPERPELAAHCEREAPGFARRLAVRPGIAGLAQARRGSAVRPRDKLRYDLLYMRAMGPWLDLKLLAASLASVARRRGPLQAPWHARADSFLSYADARPAGEGLNHERRNLECLVTEAHALGRLAVLPALRLAPRHNFGEERAWRWTTYFDFDASVVVDGAGRSRPLALAVAAADPGGAVRVDRRARIPTSVRHAVRRVASPVWHRDLPRGRLPDARVELRPAARVLALARPAIAALDREPEGFAAVHVRRGDRLFGPMRWLTGPGRIRRRLRALGIGAGTAVFVLSDERDPRFWKRLEQHLRVVRYADFPALAELVAPGAPRRDNYLLYEVEKAVMRAARTRLETFPGPEYGPAEAVLVPAAVWWAARFVRRTRHAGLRLARRIAGERWWRRVRSLRGRLGRHRCGGTT